MSTDQQIQKITDIIVEEIQRGKVFLFGSYTSGVPTKSSDVGFIVIVNKILNRIDGKVKLNLKTVLPNFIFPKNFKMYSIDKYNNLKGNKLSFLHGTY
ncbi:MAG: nucleotidyltransferase domain-containing protein [Ginsengibacter sp.]